MKVVASDAPSNPPGAALTDERESHYFEVDTTPPRIDELNGSVEKGELRITFRASDEFSVIKRAEYSVDAGDWQYLEPAGRISDTRTESYNFSLPEPGAQNSNAREAPTTKANKPGTKAIGDPPSSAPTEHLIVVRVWDRFDNMATAKTVIRPK